MTSNRPNTNSFPSADDVRTNSGFGLYMISQICRSLGGWLTLVSGTDCLRYYDKSIALKNTFFNGTAVGIRIQPSKIMNFQKTIDDIRRNGELEAKSIKHAFKTASSPSKGLMN